MQEILRELEQAAYGQSRYTVFDDWLDLMLYALMGDDDNYLKIVNKYNNDKEVGKRPIDRYAKAMGLLMFKMAETNRELLGDIYMSWNINNKYTGQFFTPYHIADFMAKIINPTGGNILDPACGSGIMIVAAAKNMTSEQIDNSVFYGQDLDLTCVKMTALNMLFFNLNGYAVLGNTLAFEVREVYQTRRSYFGGSIRKLNGDDLEMFRRAYNHRVEKLAETKEKMLVRTNDLVEANVLGDTNIVGKHGQLILF